ncbi:MAG: kinase [Tissierellia bacterium]|jgi:pseudouridine kinase|nr:kinase [Tissierellia bacterium]HKM02000.1 carbohydrate kinase family protein [Sedimentibacter sp.]
MTEIKYEISDYVTVVGGVNIDIQGFPKGKLIPEDSNIGTVKISLGGVGRNIGENLIRLGVKTKIISVLGDDIYSNKILVDSADIGLDMTDSMILKGENASIYLAVLDEENDMHVAINSMDIMEKMSVDYIKGKKHVLLNSKLCVLDTNIPADVMEYLLYEYKNKGIFLDTVSVTKAKRVKEMVGYIHTIKTNRLEIEAITDIEAKDEESLRKNGEYLLSKGVKQVFITLGKNGVFYCNKDTMKIIKANNIKAINATGAGDAFMAALIYSYLSNINIDESAELATAASIIALSHENTINPHMSTENINLKRKELSYDKKVFGY